MSSSVLFLCACGSSRAFLAASLLTAVGGGRFEAWATPPQSQQERVPAEQVLQEQGIIPLALDHLITPAFGMHWDLGIVLCSGATDT